MKRLRSTDLEAGLENQNPNGPNIRESILPIPSPSEEEILSCFNEECDITEKVAKIRDLLDRKYDYHSRLVKLVGYTECTMSCSHLTHPYPSETLSEAVLSSREEYYTQVFMNPQFLSILSVDIFWIFSLSILHIPFDTYIMVMEENKISDFLRLDVMQSRMEENIQEQDALSSIFVDIFTYLFRNVYSCSTLATTTSPSLTQKCKTIVGQLFNIQIGTTVRDLDLYILKYALDITHIIEDAAAVKQFKSDYFSILLSTQIDPSNSDQLRGFLDAVLDSFDRKEVLLGLGMMLTSEGEIILDREAAVAVDPQHCTVVVVYQRLLSIQDESVIRQSIMSLLIDLATTSVLEGQGRGLLRSLRLLEYSQLHIPNYKRTFCNFLEVLFNTDNDKLAESHSGGASMYTLSEKLFSFLCLTLLEAIPWVSKQTLIWLRRAVEINKSIHLDSADTFLRAVRIRLESITKFEALFHGDLVDKTVFEEEVSRLQSWITSNQRNGHLPPGISQQCLLGGSRGVESIFRAMEVLAKAQPNMWSSCVALVRDMCRGSPVLCSVHTAEEFIAKGGRSDATVVEIFMNAMHPSASVEAPLRELVSLFTSLIDRIPTANSTTDPSLGSSEDYNELALSSICRALQCVESHSLSAADESTVYASVCLLLQQLLHSYSFLSSSSSSHREWLRRFFSRILEYQNKLSTCYHSLVLEMLDRAHFDEYASHSIGVALAMYNEQMLLRFLDIILSQEERARFVARVYRLHSSLAYALEECLQQQREAALRPDEVDIEVEMIPLLTRNPVLTQAFLYFTNVALEISTDTITGISLYTQLIAVVYSTPLLLSSTQWTSMTVAAIKHPLQSMVRKMFTACDALPAGGQMNVDVLWNSLLLISRHQNPTCESAEGEGRFVSDMGLVYREVYRRLVVRNMCVESGEQQEMSYVRRVTRALTRSLLQHTSPHEAAIGIRALMANATVDFLKCLNSVERSKLLLVFLDECSSVDMLLSISVTSGTRSEPFETLQKHWAVLALLRCDLLSEPHCVSVLHSRGVPLRSPLPILLHIHTAYGDSKYTLASQIIRVAEKLILDMLKGDLIVENVTNKPPLSNLHNVHLGWCFLSLLQPLGISIEDSSAFMDFIVSTLPVHPSSTQQGEEILNTNVVFVHAVLCGCLLRSLSLSLKHKHDVLYSHIALHTLTLAKQLTPDTSQLLTSVQAILNDAVSPSFATLLLKMLYKSIRLTTDLVGVSDSDSFLANIFSSDL